MTALGTFFKALFGASSHPTDFTVEGALFDNFWLWITAILFCMPVRSYASSLPFRMLPRFEGTARNIILLSRIGVGAILLIVSVALLIGATNNAFLYTRF